MPSVEFETFRRGLEILFRNMHEQGLSDAARDRLRMAFDYARKNRPQGAAPALTSQLKNFHDRLIGYLNDADRELSRQEVEHLEAIVREHLPSY